MTCRLPITLSWAAKPRRSPSLNSVTTNAPSASAGTRKCSQDPEAYGDKVRLVYRDFPLYGVHPNAESAAEAANCAGEQDQYYDFHNLLLSGQKEFGAETYSQYAQSLKLNMDTFKSCMDEHRYLAEVKADYEYASQLGVRSTPTFFVNGLAVVGAQPFEVFQQVIDLELAGKIPK